jgi:hypothetical protein
MDGKMAAPFAISDPRLAVLFHYWHAKRRGRIMPAPADINLAELPAAVQPNTMILDVVRSETAFRLRYRHIGGVFWRGTGKEPVGAYVDEVLPETAGYRRYVVGIYEEMVARRAPMYSENAFILREGHRDPTLAKRVSLPLSNDGTHVDMVLAGHAFDHRSAMGDESFSLVTSLEERARHILAAA